jgi:AcrR family transcriptional regulator
MQGGTGRLTRAQQKTLTRERLVDAARRVIARRGLTGASVDAISEDAGFSSGAFYSNFESKDEVFAAALEYHAREFDRFLDDHPATGSIRARLAADGQWLDSLEDWRVLFWLEIVAHGGRSSALEPSVREYFDSARARLTHQVEEGARESGTALARPAAELARLVLAAEIGLFVQGLFDDEAGGRSSLAALLELLEGDGR